MCSTGTIRRVYRHIKHIEELVIELKEDQTPIKPADLTC
jgi:hypothetical protein